MHARFCALLLLGYEALAGLQERWEACRWRARCDRRCGRLARLVPGARDVGGQTSSYLIQGGQRLSLTHYRRGTEGRQAGSAAGEAEVYLLYPRLAHGCTRLAVRERLEDRDRRVETRGRKAVVEDRGGLWRRLGCESRGGRGRRLQLG